MIRKIVKVHRMDECSEIEENLRYWLSRPPEERLAAVDELRRQPVGWALAHADETLPTQLQHGLKPILLNFKEPLELFNAHKVEYLIVGGYALAFHGAPRYTGDIDLYTGTRAFGPMLTMSRDRWM